MATAQKKTNGNTRTKTNGNGNGSNLTGLAASAATKVSQGIVPEMSRTLVQRDEEIRLLVLSLIARTHLALIGRWGIAKSLALDTFMSHVSDDVRMFKKTIRKGTNVEELFGPPSVKRMLDEDVFEYNIASTLAEANLAMLTEIWKGNSPTLNSLLRVINEREFENGTHVIDVPLWSLIADSNELPPPSEHDLMAMRDRFGMTKIVEPVRTRDGLLAILDTQLAKLSGTSLTGTHTMISRAEIEALQDAVTKVTIPPNVRQAYAELQMKASHEGLDTASSRRHFEGLKVCAANAVLRGDTELRRDDLRLMAYNLWTFPEEVKTAEKLVLEYAGQTAKRAVRFRESLEEVTREVNDLAQKLPADGSQPDPNLYGEIGVQHANLQNLRKKVDSARDDAESSGDDSSDLDAILANIDQTQRVIKKALYADD